MPVTPQDLENFNEFALQHLAKSGADSVLELARQWEAQRETNEAIADILAAEADIDSGRVHKASNVFAQLHDRPDVGR